MISRLSKALLLVLILSLTIPVAALAAEEGPREKVRLVGEITSVSPGERWFGLRTRQGDEVRVFVNEDTKYRSREGEIQGIGDLEAGMKALVVGVRNPGGHLTALVVAAGKPGDLPNLMRVAGIIQSIGDRTFSLKTRTGEEVTFAVGERTKFRSRDGSVQSFADLQAGMGALVLAAKGEDELPMALVVAAGNPEDRPERFRLMGEITRVMPDQSAFQLKTREGELKTVQVSERTRFRSRDGSIQGLEDLEVGMLALAAGVKGEDGALNALLVAAGKAEDRPKPPKTDVRAAGRIVDIGGRSFSLKTRSGETMTFAVTEATIFKSRDGSVSSFEDLEVGMVAIVGAKRSADGGLVAVWVGAGKRRAERPQRPAGERPDLGIRPPLDGRPMGGEGDS